MYKVKKRKRQISEKEQKFFFYAKEKYIKKKTKHAKTGGTLT
jgi:hypothetical protein